MAIDLAELLSQPDEPRKGNLGSYQLTDLLGVEPAAGSAQEEPKRTVLGTIGDVANVGLKAAISVPEAAVGLADIPTGGKVGKALQSIGIDFKRAKEASEEMLASDAQKAADKKVNDAEGFVGTAKAMIQNPSTIAKMAGESAGLLLSGAAIGRGVAAAAPKLAGWAGGIGEGVVGAGSAAENIRQQTADGELSLGQAAAAVGTGAGTAVFGRIGQKMANKFGLQDIDEALVRGTITPNEASGYFNKIGKAAIAEGVFEELPQSMQEQVWENVALGRRWDENLGKAAAQGLLTGSAMGGGFQAVSGLRKDETAPATAVDTEKSTQQGPTRSQLFMDNAFAQVEGDEGVMQQQAVARSQLAVALSQLDDGELDLATTHLSRGDQNRKLQLVDLARNTDAIKEAKTALGADLLQYVDVADSIRRDAGITPNDAFDTPSAPQIAQAVSAEIDAQQTNTAGFAPEPAAQLQAQLLAVADGRKPAAFMGADDANRVNLNGLSVAQVVDPETGETAVIAARDDATVQQLSTRVDEVGLKQAAGEILGYADPTQTSAPSPDAVAVQQIDNTGQVIDEQLVTPESAGGVQRIDGTQARVLPVQQAMFERQQAVAQEQPQAAVEEGALAQEPQLEPVQPTGSPDTDAFVASLNQQLGLDPNAAQAVDPRSIKAYSPPKKSDLSKLVAGFREALGVKLVVVETSPEGLMRRDGTRFNSFNGVAYSGDTLILNAQAATPLNTLGHELAHLLKRQQPDLYAKLEIAVLSRLSFQRAKQFREQLQAALQAEGNPAEIEAEFREELVAEAIGESAQDMEFWKDVFSQFGEDQASAKSLYDTVIDLLARLAKAFTKQGFISGVKDLQKVRRATTDAFIEWSARQENPNNLSPENVATLNQMQKAAGVKRTPAKEPQFARSLPPPEPVREMSDLLAAAQSMREWKTWYDTYEEYLRGIFGEDTALFKQLLSATSQAASVPANVGLALKAYQQLLSNQPFEGYLAGVRFNLERIRNQEQIKGLKIGEFGKANDGDDQGVAIDRHVSEAIFGNPKPTPAMIEMGKGLVRRLAAELGWKPKEVQAALWAWNIKRKGGNPESYDAQLAKPLNQQRIADIRKQFPEGFGSYSARSAAASADAQTDGRTVPGPQSVTADGIKFSRQKVTELDPVKPITLSDLVGRKVFPVFADLTAAGEFYMGQRLLGGPFFALLPQFSNAGIVWANDGKAVTGRKANLFKEGATVGIVVAMTDVAHASNASLSNIIFSKIEAAIDDGQIPRENLAALNQLVEDYAYNIDKNTGERTLKMKKDEETKKMTPTAAAALATFPGLDKRTEAEAWLRSATFDTRAEFFTRLGQAAAQKLGVPDFQKILRDSMEETLQGLNKGDAILAIEFNAESEPVKLGTGGTEIHPSYAYGLKGRVIGKFERPIAFKNIWKDWYAKRRAEKANPTNDYRSLQLSMAPQVITKDIADAVPGGAYEAIRSPAHAIISDALLRSKAQEMRKTGDGAVSFVRNAASNDLGLIGKEYTESEVKKLVRAGDMRVFSIAGTRIDKEGKAEVNRVWMSMEKIDGAWTVTNLVNNEPGTGHMIDGLLALAVQNGAERIGVSDANTEEYPDGRIAPIAELLGFQPVDGSLTWSGNDRETFISRLARESAASLRGRPAAGQGAGQPGLPAGAVDQANRKPGRRNAGGGQGPAQAARRDGLLAGFRAGAEASRLSPIERENLGLTPSTEIKFSRAGQKNTASSRVNDTSADRFKRTEQLQTAVQDLQDGKITRDDYNRMVDDLRPVEPYAEVPPLTTEQRARFALATGRGQSPEKAAKYGLPSQQLKEGDPAQLRLDIPSYQNHDAWVVSVHTPKTTNADVQAAYDAGPVIGYESAAALTDVTFGMNQKAALKIATGSAKGTIATALGKWKPVTAVQAKKMADAAIKDPAWTQVGMDPFRHSYFYDRDTMQPVLAADEVIQVGPLMLAKNAKFDTQGKDITGAPILFSRAPAPDSQAFKDWFKKSKAADAQGQPKVMYHGTARDITVFQPKQADAIFVTEDPDFAETFSGDSEDYMMDEAYFGASEEQRMEWISEAIRQATKNGNITPKEAKALRAQLMAYPDSFGVYPPGAEMEMMALIKDALPSRANILPVYVSVQKPFDYQNVIHVLDVIERFKDKTLPNIYGEYSLTVSEGRKLDMEELRESLERGEWTVIESRPIQEAIRSLRFDGFYVKEGGRKNLAVYKSEQIKSATGNYGTYDPANPDIRFSRNATKLMSVQDVLNFAQTGKLNYQLDDALARGQYAQAFQLAKNKQQRKQLSRRLMDGVITKFADSLIPVQRWIESIPMSDLARQRLLGDMRRADTVRSALEKEVKAEFAERMYTAVDAAVKATGMTADEVKKIAGTWMSAKYAPKANRNLIAKDRAALLAAQQSGDAQAIAQAQQNLADRLADVNSPVGATGFKRGVAGGFSNATAVQIKAEMERMLGANAQQLLNDIAQPVYDMLKWKQQLDLRSGKVTQQMVNSWPNHADYVPLTGDPRFNPEYDDAFQAGNRLNQDADKAMNGRKDSIADDGIDAAFTAVVKSVNVAAMQDFKRGLNEVFESAQRSGTDIGLKRGPITGIVTPSRDYVIYRDNVTNPNGTVSQKAYAFQFDDPRLIESLKRHNEEVTNTLLRMLSAPTRWYGRLVTQFSVAFAPINFVRDLWERSELLRTREIFDVQGNKVDVQAVARASLKDAAFNPQLWQASFKVNFKKAGASQARADLEEMIKLGGSSTWGDYLARAASDLEADINANVGKITRGANTALEKVEAYNNVFEMIAPLAIYRALKDANVAPKDAAAATLDLMNFRKRGTVMPGMRALYVFAQPAATSGYNLARYLSTPVGKKRFAAQVVIGGMLYALLAGLWGDEDEEELGNKLDNLSNYTVERSIPVPMGDMMVKLPVGFGPPQLAWAMAGIVNRISSGRYTAGDGLMEAGKAWLKSASPVAPSDIEISERPGQWLLQTFTPTVAKPLLNIGADMTGLGLPLTPQFKDADKMNYEQARRNTPDLYKDIAKGVYELSGMDIYPDQIKALVDGYGIGPIREIVSIFVDNPAKETRGEPGRIPVLSSIVDNVNDRTILNNIYYRERDKLQDANKEFNRRMEDGTLDELEPGRLEMAMAFKQFEAQERALGTMRSALQKADLDPDANAEQRQAIESQGDEMRRQVLLSALRDQK